MSSFVDMLERASVRASLYLQHHHRQSTIDTNVLTAVMYHQRDVSDKGGWSLYGEAVGILNKYSLDADTPPRVLKDLHSDARHSSLSRRKIHGVYYKELNRPSRSLPDCTLWLRKRNFSSQTEGTMFAIQDGVVLTRGYRRRVFRSPINDRCRLGCGARETVSHILSSCPSYCFTLYKICRRYGFPSSIGHLNSPGFIDPQVYYDQASGIKISLDCLVQTSSPISERRPDLIIENRKERYIEIFEVACALDSLIEDREKEKEGKYQELARDMAASTSYNVEVYPIVIGDIGCMSKLPRYLHQCQSISPGDVSNLIVDIQAVSITSAVRLVKRHLRQRPGKAKGRKRSGKARTLRRFRRLPFH